MAERNETLADIVAEMRRERFYCGGMTVPSVARIVRGYADRIEAAYGRENHCKKRYDKDGDEMPPHCAFDDLKIGRLEGRNAELKAEVEHFRGATKLVGIVEKMRKAFEKVLAIEGYGAPWIEAKTIAQNALEIALPDEAIAQKPESFCNAAKLREALEKCITWAATGECYYPCEDCVHDREEFAKEALAAPPRNCDRFGSEEDAYKAWQASRGWTSDAEERCGYGAAWAYAKWLFAPVLQAHEQEGGET